MSISRSAVPSSAQPSVAALARAALLAGAFCASVAGLAPTAARAGEADVVAVKVLPMKQRDDNIYRFRVTVRHDDTGWDHYADAWQVLGPGGKILGTRVLHHPHVEEQPFTRYHDIEVPAGIAEVTIRARDKVHGFGGAEMTAEIPGR